MERKNILLFILAAGVFGILNTEMGFIGILPYIAEEYNVTIVQAGRLISLFALGVAVIPGFCQWALSDCRQYWMRPGDNGWWLVYRGLGNGICSDGWPCALRCSSSGCLGAMLHDERCGWYAIRILVAMTSS